MKLIYPSFQRFFWSETRLLINISIIAWVVVFFKWKFASYPDPSLWLGRALVIYGALILFCLIFRWFLLVPRVIEINENAVTFCFYFRERICFSSEDIEKYYFHTFQVFIIQLKNGRIIKVLPSPYSDQQWAQLLQILGERQEQE